MPEVSVLLPVYNGMPYLPSALDSLLAQDHGDFEIIAIDDGSTDASAEHLQGRRDSRLRVLRQANHGLASTLNRALSVSSSPYIARQDQDDISRPSRLTRQIAYLRAHPRCGLLGTWADVWQEDTPTSRRLSHPTGNAELQVLGLFDTRFVHSSVMARRDAIDQAGGYPTAPERNPPEDFDLWSRMAAVCELANLPEPLLTYREVGTSISRAQSDTIAARVNAIAVENLSRLIGPESHPGVYAALVAAVRREPMTGPGGRRWRQWDSVLRAVSSRLVERFPDERPQVRRAVGRLRLQVARSALSSP